MTIYLNAEVFSSFPGEVNFWVWAERSFPNTHRGLPDVRQLPGGRLADSDIVLQYSTLGPCSVPGGKKIALLWELHPEMKARLGGRQWDQVLAKIEACGRESDFRTTATPAMLPYYDAQGMDMGPIDVLPLGVDTDLFRPAANDQERNDLRLKYNLPVDGHIGFWAGTKHPMKGFDGVLDLSRSAKGTHWAIVWKSPRESQQGLIENATEFVNLPQDQLAEIMRACDFFACTGRLRPYFMVEWEAMAVDLSFVYETPIEREFSFRPGESTRGQLLAKGWCRHCAKRLWLEYLEKVSASCCEK